MVKKIKSQEKKLADVIRDINMKEEYVQQVQFEMKQIDEINLRIKEELEKTKQEKVDAESHLKSTIAEQEAVLVEINKQKSLIAREQQKEEKEIKKFRTIAESKEKVIHEYVRN